MSYFPRFLESISSLKLDKSDTKGQYTHTITNLAGKGKEYKLNIANHDTLLGFIQSYMRDIEESGGKYNTTYIIKESLNTNMHKFYVTAHLPSDITSPTSIVSYMRSILNEYVHESLLDTCIIASDNNNNSRFIWPKFLVIPQNAAIIVTRLIALFSYKDKYLSGEYRWANIFTQPSKYVSKNSMETYPYTIQDEECPSCSTREERVQCMRCGGSGKQLSGDLAMRITHLVTFNEDGTKNVETIEGFANISLLVGASLASTYFTSDIPENFDPFVPDVTYPVGTPHCPSVSKNIRASGMLYGAQKKDFKPVSEHFARFLQSIIRKMFPMYHSKAIVSVDGVFVDQKRKRIIVCIKGPGCCTCENKGKDHKDSYIWFLIEPAGIKQLCNSKELVDHMPCNKRARQKPFRKIPNEAVKRCFPTHTENGSSNNLATISKKENELNLVDMNIAMILKKQETNCRKTNVLDEFIK